MNPKLFLSGLKNSYIHTYPVCKSNLPVHTYPTSIRVHSRTQNSSGNIGNRACVVKRTKFACCSAFHGKELGLILLRHRVKKFPDLASTRFQIHSVFKNFHSEERIQKNSGFICCIHRIRVDGSRIRKEKVADSKISGYVRGRGLRGNCLWLIGEEYQIGN